MSHPGPPGLPQVARAALRHGRGPRFRARSPGGTAMLLAGKVAVVTGGASGVGRAVALALAREGAAVVVGDRHADAAEATARAALEAGGRATALAADSSRVTDVRALVEQTVAAHGRLDLAFNAADGDEAAPED